MISRRQCNLEVKRLMLQSQPASSEFTLQDPNASETEKEASDLLLVGTLTNKSRQITCIQQHWWHGIIPNAKDGWLHQQCRLALFGSIQILLETGVGNSSSAVSGYQDSEIADKELSTGAAADTTSPTTSPVATAAAACWLYATATTTTARYSFDNQEP
jgi:hypothetical protein